MLNPVGRVPTLELDDGTILTESKLILDYIDALNPGPKLLPRDGSDGWRTLAEVGQALGLLEGIVTWIRALVPPEPQRAAVAIARESAVRRMRWRLRLLAVPMQRGLMRRRSFWARRWGWWSRDCRYGNGGRDDLSSPAGMTRLRRELRFG